MSTTNNLILTLLFITFLVLFTTHKSSTRRVYDYHIDIISRDSVVVGTGEGREYPAHIDSIQAVIEKDNL